MQVLMYICIYVRMVCMYGIYKWRSDKGWIVAAIRNMHSMSVYMYVCTVVPSPGLSLSGKDTESLFPATRAPTGCPHRPRTSLHMESSSVYVVCIYMQSMGFIRVVPFSALPPLVSSPPRPWSRPCAVAAAPLAEGPWPPPQSPRLAAAYSWK